VIIALKYALSRVKKSSLTIYSLRVSYRKGFSSLLEPQAFSFSVKAVAGTTSVGQRAHGKLLGANAAATNKQTQ